MRLLEPVKLILIIVLVVSSVWFIGHLVDDHYQQRDERRSKLFREAIEDCYKRERSCDAIFENLYEDLFPEPADNYDN